MTDANRHPAPWSTRLREAKRRGAARATDDVRAIDEAGRVELTALRRRLADDHRAAEARLADRRRRRAHRARVGLWLGGLALAAAAFVSTAPAPSAPLAAGPITTVSGDVAHAALLEASDRRLASLASLDTTPAVEAPATPVETAEPPPAPAPARTSPPRRWTPPAPPSLPAAAACDDGIGDPCCAFGEMVC